MKIIPWVLLAILAFTATTMVVAKDPVCDLPIMISAEDAANCEVLSEVWAYRADGDECVSFIHGSCAENTNEFKTLEECEEKCKS